MNVVRLTAATAAIALAATGAVLTVSPAQAAPKVANPADHRTDSSSLSVHPVSHR